MAHNLALSAQSEKNRLNTDLAAARGASNKEHYNIMPVTAGMVEQEQPVKLRAWFRKRLAHHRQYSQTLPRLP